jgi:KDO2-lipid IV(A) lauroyltransferase
MRSVKKGFYSVKLYLVTDILRRHPYGEITEKLTRNLEDQIRRDPAPWLWSHRRWKKEVPKNVDELRAEFKANHEKWLKTLDS